MKRDLKPEQQLEHYLVGGAVRDALLGRPVKDRDWVVVGSSVKQMLALGFKPVGKDFPVFLHPVTAEEYALARTERKSGHGYSGFICHAAPDVTLEADLLRRDLTINAIAQAPDGTLTDPYGGLEDLKTKRLRHVSSAFSEDPLRILRVARFAARYAPLGFEVADETLALMQAMVASGEASHLVPERVWQETVRALGEAKPAVYFEVLQQCGALEIVLPSIAQALNEGWPNLKALELAETASPLERFGCIACPCAAAQPQQMIQALDKALRLPRDYLDLIKLQAQTQSLWPELEHTEAPAAAPLLQLFNRADLWRRPERLARLLVSYRLLQAAEGQPANALRWIEISQKRVQEVSIRPLQEQGLSGAALGKALQQARLDAITQALNNTTD